MSAENTRSLSNNFQDVRLVSLSSWRNAAEISPRDHGGPYVVMQDGYAPDDIKLLPDEFVLGRSGRWLSVALFYRLPVPDRRAEFVFGTAAEVMKVMGDLSPKVTIFKPGDDQLAPESAAGADEMAAAIKAGSKAGKGAN